MWKIPVGTHHVSAAYETAPEKERAVFVCAHGAGGNMSDRSVLAVSRALQPAGVGVVRLNFPYSERKSKRPDSVPTLTQTIAAVVDRVRAELAPPRLLIGGRSMGGRMASMLAADGFEADGLLLLAYPLHAPGQTHKLRDAHLGSIRMPILCFNGTRDTFCQPNLMKAVVKTLGNDWTMHWLEGADHGFHVLKSSGRTDADVFAEVARTTTTWIENLR